MTQYRCSERSNFRLRVEYGAGIVPVAWTVKDSKGELVPGFIAGSPREVGRKIARTRYDAFRLEVSPSYSRTLRSGAQERLAARGLADRAPQAPNQARRRPGQLELKLN